MTSSFFAGGNKSLSFGPIGDTSKMGVWMGGKVLAKTEPHQAADMQGNLKTFKSGDPVMKIVITLATWQGKTPDPQRDADDDGVRDWHVEQGSPDMRAVQAALRDAKAPGMDIQVGSELYVVWTHEEPAKTAGFGNKRVKSARYIPPTEDPNAFFAQQTAPAAAPQPQFQPPPQQQQHQMPYQPSPVNPAPAAPQQPAAAAPQQFQAPAQPQQFQAPAQPQQPAQQLGPSGPPANPFLNGQAPQQPSPFGQAPGAQQFQPQQFQAPAQPQQFQAPAQPQQPGGVPPFPS